MRFHTWHKCQDMCRDDLVEWSSMTTLRAKGDRGGVRDNKSTRAFVMVFTDMSSVCIVFEQNHFQDGLLR